MSVFPPGMLSARVTMDAFDFGMGVVAGQWTVECETPAIWRATDLLMLKTPIPKGSTKGKASVELAASKQAGFVGRGPAGEYPIPERSYLFRFTANRDRSVYERWVYVPASSTPVSLASLPDLGGWPTLTPVGGSPVGGLQYVEGPPGLFKWKATT